MMFSSEMFCELVCTRTFPNCSVNLKYGFNAWKVSESTKGIFNTLLGVSPLIREALDDKKDIISSEAAAKGLAVKRVTYKEKEEHSGNRNIDIPIID